jgi:molybdopterin synthase catalytic subunit
MFALTEEPIDVLAVEAAVTHTRHGAVLLFLGVARDHFEGRAVALLEYEAYPEMVMPAMAALDQAVTDQWPGARTAIVHRLGRVPIGEVAVVVATSTPHRGDCYAANRFAIEQLKATLPIWKKEVYADGSAWKANNTR